MCFDIGWFESLIIWIIVVCAIIALLKLLVSFVLPKLGLAGEVMGFLVEAFRIIIVAIICIAVVVFVFELITCLLPSLHGLPRLRQ